MFTFNFNGFDLGETEECTIVIKLGNAEVGRSTMPLIFARNKMIEAMNSANNDSRPIQVKCIKDYYTESGKKLEDSIIYENQAYKNAFGGKE